MHHHRTTKATSANANLCNRVRQQLKDTISQMKEKQMFAVQYV